MSLINQNKDHKEQQENENLVSFFELLLKIDKRENPKRYKINNDRK